MSTYQTNINTIISVLFREGLRHAVICPGSRNAPLIMAFVRFGKIKCISVADERSAGFVALGMAKQLGSPVAVICTSGSAVLNLYPAIGEAFYMQIPLLVITADRPANMLDRWDGQTIHQTGVFKPHVLASFATPEDLDNDRIREIGDVSTKLYRRSNQELKGPVHLNVPLKEPLYAAAASEFSYPDVLMEEEAPEERKKWEFLLDEEKFKGDIQKVMILHGAGNPSHGVEMNHPGDKEFAVVISDVISNRHSEANIRNWEGILLNATEVEQRELIPDLLITTGKMVLNKSLKNLFRKYQPARHWHVDESGYCADTFFTDPVNINLSPSEFFEQFTPFLPTDTSGYFKIWKTLSDKHQQTSEVIFSENFNAFSAIKKLLQQLPDNIVLHLANSMSVRYAAYFNELLKDSWDVHSNRGVSGIDGCTSTAVGAAMVDTRTHVLITGDIAFFYDINALWQKNMPHNFKLVLLNDFGGGIFRNIDGPGQLPEFDPYLETPHKMDARLLAEHFKLDHCFAKNMDELMTNMSEWIASGKASLLEIQTDAEINARVFNNYKQKK